MALNAFFRSRGHQPRLAYYTRIAVGIAPLLALLCLGCQVWLPDESGEDRPSRPRCASDADCLPDTKCLESTVKCDNNNVSGSDNFKPVNVGKYCDTDVDDNGKPDLEDAKWTPCCKSSEQGICVEVTP
ncbi:MAG TPA: hypothetical protein DCQ06_13565 [Myxococcales bacterium]|nr:hypothetical protein [Myxococcales bacterium]HAN32618.1 hypothetical protein [Myxococcales bacterium]